MNAARAIALTGGIACGKSEVAGMLSGMGVPVLDTDALAHTLLTPGHWMFEKVVARFGREYLTAEGSLDRRKLGRLIFADDEARAALNAMMHPAIYDTVFEWMRGQASNCAVAMIPLLYETGMESRFDRVLAVASDEALMIRRMKARGWTDDEVRSRMNAQMPLAEKVRRADVVIWNNEDLPALQRATREAWEITVEKEEQHERR